MLSTLNRHCFVGDGFPLGRGCARAHRISLWICGRDFWHPLVEFGPVHGHVGHHDLAEDHLGLRLAGRL
ncbi:MAG: hypothetical protein DWC11_01270, partial [Candidatus Poseidoniales archaeon]